jgi:CTP synthase
VLEASDLEQDTKHENPVRYHEAWQQLCSSNGVLIPGGFGVRGMEGKILAAEWARKNKKPMLGVCLGLQCAVIEFARNVLGWKDAHSTEADSTTTHPVVIEMPEHHPGHLGGTMRLGKRKTIFKTSQESILQKLYKNAEFVEERHRHRYEVNPSVVNDFEAAGLMFVGQDVDGKRMEIMELKDHPYYVAVQYHPEYLTRPLKPSAPYLGLLLASCGRLQSYVSHGCRLSPYYNQYHASDNSLDSGGEEDGGADDTADELVAVSSSSSERLSRVNTEEDSLVAATCSRFATVLSTA